VYVENRDVLRIAAASSQAGEVLTVSWRLLLPSGDIVLNQASLAVPASRFIAIHDEPMAEGFLLSVACSAAVAITRGQTFARIFLTNPDLGAGQPSYMLMADYVTTAMAPSHPNGRVLAPTEGPGWLHNFGVVAPGPGADWVIVVPRNARWRLQGVTGVLSTGIAVANRNTSLRGLGGAQNAFQAISSAVQAASLAITYTWAPGVESRTSSGLNVTSIPIPYGHNLSGIAGDSLDSSTFNIQAADQWSAIGAVIEEWLENV
jgi:hypothetical protein